MRIRPVVECYVNDAGEKIYYSVYQSEYPLHGKLEDQVLQHRLPLNVRTSHVTIHPFKLPQWSLERAGAEDSEYVFLQRAVATLMDGYRRADGGGLSPEVKRFLLAVRGSQRRG